MIKVILGSILAGLFYIPVCNAQHIPRTKARQQATPVALPPNYTNTTINFIRIWEPNIASNDTSYIRSSARTPAEVRQTTEYQDGLGRKLQVVEKGITPDGRDFVTPFLYHRSGMEYLRYLPYAHTTGNASNGSFKADAFAAQRTFYQDTILNPSAAGEQIYYSRMQFEQAPGGRPLKSFAQGNNWALEGGNRPIATRYQVNTANDSVRLYVIGDGALLPVSTTVYPPGALFKDVLIGEDGMQTVEFKDKMGRVILKKTQSSYTPGTAHMGWHCTYQVFNRNGKLAFIIPPRLVEIIRGSWVISPVMAQELAFIFRYDHRERLIISKDPGADSIEMIYDRRDRMVVSRTGNLKRMGMAKAYLYDSINRPAGINMCYYGGTREQMQALMDTSMVRDPDNATPWIPAANLLPQHKIYYDNYNFPGKSNYVTTDLANTRIGNNPYGEAMPLSPSSRTKGKMTGQSVWLATKGIWLTTTYYYNDRGREIQTIEENYGGGKDILNKVYDFSGKLLATYLRHTNPGSVTTPQTTVHRLFHYDGAGKLDSLVITLNNNWAQRRAIAVIDYNETGQRLKERLNPSVTSQLETLHFEYNIRGWNRGINRGYANTAGSSSNWFGMDISYEQGFDSSVYTGNISGIKWKGRGDGLGRAYGFSYDPSQRLSGAYFSQQNAGTVNWAQDKMDFSVSGISYDANGNMLTMKQRGMDGLAKKTIDSLKYGYIGNSNRLYYVTDKVNDPSLALGDFKEIVNNETQDYWQDPNGNMARDRNKDIDTITYDHNNLITYMRVKHRGDIYWVRGGDGRLLAKVVVDTSNTARTVVTHYANGFTYYNGTPIGGSDTLQEITHDRGRIRAIYKVNQPVQFAYDYFIKDHLGNTRMVLTTRSDTGIYVATMETAASIQENALFSNIDNTRSAKPSSYPADNTTNPNAYVARTNGSTGQKIGPSKILRLMAGDTVAISCKGYYENSAATQSVNNAQSIVTSFLQAMTGVSLMDGVHEATGSTSPLSVFDGNIYNAVKNLNPAQNQSVQPKAYLNYVFFDDQFNMVPENSGVRQVQGSTGQLINLVLNKQAVKKTGWLYIYTSNESAVDVYFDNLVITHTSGPLTEEHHYYPHGVEMAAISASALRNSYIKNKHLFNGKELHSEEFNDGWSSQIYDFGARIYDPQIGRFHSIDPHAGRYGAISPYNFAFNNPISYVDPDGKDGKLSGSGTKEDPYVITANYYYYDLSGEEADALQSVLTIFNNAGNARVVEIDGKQVYVKFNLSAKQTNDLEAANAKSKEDQFLDLNSVWVSMGNTVKNDKDYQMPDGYKFRLADSDANMIRLKKNVTNYIAANGYPTPNGHVRLDNKKFLMTNWMHEIGHNLGLIHGDRGIMLNFNINSGEIQYGGELTNENIITLIQRANKPYGTDKDKDIDVRGGDNQHGEGGTNGRIANELP
ncbi:DUF6443 domain-containing protein [Chitinophaga rhizophila]|uniref:RHS repeat-associated core domain-containing protein n=1 Tax=Chitinophaga rhizophila TaxID=2866212 RepID=A0ABS7GAT2_9BACT|nr:DUF6443 domain-containing protein [Chitinophaga rhizophila]MBW8684772.1 RHS repeat-associated core domain-containing protein [Chitinophaga rhizophila]